MVNISKYRVYSASKSLWQKRNWKQWVFFFPIGSFVRIFLYNDSFFSFKFNGILVKKTKKGISSSIVIMNKKGLVQRFFFFSPIVFSFKIYYFKYKFKKFLLKTVLYKKRKYIFYIWIIIKVFVKM